MIAGEIYQKLINGDQENTKDMNTNATNLGSHFGSQAVHNMSKKEDTISSSTHESLGSFRNTQRSQT